MNGTPNNAGALHEISAAIDLGARFRIGREGLAVHIETIPQAKRTPDVVREAQLGRRHLVVHRRKTVEIRLEVDQILIGHALVGRIGKGRVEIGAVRRHPSFHRVDEIERGPIADAGALVGRDIKVPNGVLRQRPPARISSFLILRSPHPSRGTA
jgi:hypothetical protein